MVEIGVSTVTTLWTVFAPAWGWIALGSVALGLAAYWLHTHERQRMDALGTQAFDAELTDPPWRSLWIGGGVLAVCATVAIAGPRTNTLAMLTVALTYLLGTVPTGIVTERIVRADRCHPRLDWTPRYDRELFLLRASVVIGAVAMVGYVIGPSVSVPPLTVVGVGLFAPVVAIAGYLYCRTMYDLGSDWRLF